MENGVQGYTVRKYASLRYHILIIAAFEDLERGSRMNKHDIQQLKDANGDSKTIALLCQSSIEFIFTWLRLVRAGYSVLIIA